MVRRLAGTWDRGLARTLVRRWAETLVRRPMSNTPKSNKHGDKRWSPDQRPVSFRDAEFRSSGDATPGLALSELMGWFESEGSKQ